MRPAHPAAATPLTAEQIAAMVQPSPFSFSLLPPPSRTCLLVGQPQLLSNSTRWLTTEPTYNIPVDVDGSHINPATGEESSKWTCTAMRRKIRKVLYYYTSVISQHMSLLYRFLVHISYRSISTRKR